MDREEKKADAGRIERPATVRRWQRGRSAALARTPNRGENQTPQHADETLNARQALAQTVHLPATGVADFSAPLPCLTVAELNRCVAGLLDSGLGVVEVEGELAGLSRPASGHLYGTLRDPTSSVRMAIFRGVAQRLRFIPKEGMRVRVRARVTLYEARGDYQLIVEAMTIAGAGDLHARFLALKVQLQAEGVFDAAGHAPLPETGRLRRIGVITSRTAAALQDVLATLQRRAPQRSVIVYPASVQGELAPRELLQALEVANRRCEVDVLLLVRGGGAFEDLMAFNDETLVRAVALSRIPVVSGVGHETDFTLVDFAASRRAETPTAAAVAVTPDRDAQIRHLRGLARRLHRAVVRHADLAAQRVDISSHRLVSPVRRLARQQSQLEGQAVRLRAVGVLLASGVERRLEQAAARLRPPATLPARQQLAALVGRLLRAGQAVHEPRMARLEGLHQALVLVGPDAVLGRGYALVVDGSGHLIRDAADVAPGTVLAVRLARGKLDVTVQRSHPEPGAA